MQVWKWMDPVQTKSTTELKQLSREKMLQRMMYKFHGRKVVEQEQSTRKTFGETIEEIGVECCFHQR
ncbi:unnamed protein product [Trifolium pratense]|uniref:Uncharacterized protein n=1 Tax=Trifolium pratense TaxID=57577 RepID=A0ACB0KAI6_TRIPR|nr:unnamed protein product [Trifolium pratense]